jgi:hypothetical protein
LPPPGCWSATGSIPSRRAADLAEQFAQALDGVAACARTTFVAWEDPEPPATRERPAAGGLVGCDLPRDAVPSVSVGAGNGEIDLERLLAAL